MNCTKDGWIGSWESIEERIRDVQACNCLCCRDWLDRECPDELIENANQTQL